MLRLLEVTVENWPIAGGFRDLARTRKPRQRWSSPRSATALAPAAANGCPTALWRKVEGVVAAVRAMADAVGRRPRSRQSCAGSCRPARPATPSTAPCGTSRRSSRAGASPKQLGLSPLRPVETAYTLGLGTPEAMEQAARRAASPADRSSRSSSARDGDADRIAAVRRGAPGAPADRRRQRRLDGGRLRSQSRRACIDAGVALIEQPLPAGSRRRAGGSAGRPIPICADESLHDTADLAKLADRYDAVNIKLDKTGGLTEALDLSAGHGLGLQVMVGCMVGTSLSMAPGVSAGPGRRLCRPRRAVASRPGPAGGHPLRRRDHAAARPGPLGLRPGARRIAPLQPVARARPSTDSSMLPPDRTTTTVLPRQSMRPERARRAPPRRPARPPASARGTRRRPRPAPSASSTVTARAAFCRLIAKPIAPGAGAIRASQTDPDVARVGDDAAPPERAAVVVEAVAARRGRSRSPGSRRGRRGRCPPTSPPPLHGTTTASGVSPSAWRPSTISRPTVPCPAMTSAIVERMDQDRTGLGDDAPRRSHRGRRSPGHR